MRTIGSAQAPATRAIASSRRSISPRAGALDYLVFECLAERTIALAQEARRRDPDAGFDPLLTERFKAVLPPSVANKVKIITNMGAANPVGAARAVAGVARELGLSGLRLPPSAATMSWRPCETATCRWSKRKAASPTSRTG